MLCIDVGQLFPYFIPPPSIYKKLKINVEELFTSVKQAEFNLYLLILYSHISENMIHLAASL